MTEHRISLPAEVIREDQDLEQSMESASEALGYLRWHWTLDESNPARVSIRQYALAIGKNKEVIRMYAQGYASHALGGQRPSGNFSDSVVRAGLSAEKQLAVDVVAEVNNMTFENAKRRYEPTVIEVRNAVEREREQREEQGEDFPAEEREDYARKVAKMKRDSKAAEARHREEQRHNHSLKFMEMDTLASRVRQLSKELLDVTRDVDLSVLSEEEVRLLERQIIAAHEMVGLTRTALSGDSGTDWDKALADLEEKRQYG